MHHSPPAIVREVVDLESLAVAINESHVAGEQCSHEGLEHYRRAGEDLIRAKAQVGHGKWLDWQAKHLGFSQETASGYMRLAENWTQISNGVANLRDALDKLAGPSRRKSEAPEPSYTADEPEPPQDARHSVIAQHFGREPGDDTEAIEADEKANARAHRENGRPVASIKDFNDHFGKLVRLMHERAKVLKQQKDSAYLKCEKLGNDFLKACADWWKK